VGLDAQQAELEDLKQARGARANNDHFGGEGSVAQGYSAYVREESGAGF
jgi:hypothetical protein